MPVRKRLEINLLPRDLGETFVGKFLRWILTYGRYIVIGTEIIVLLAFLSRFKLDRDLSDLSESIKTKETIIQASSELENNVRSLQKRLSLIKNLQEKEVSSPQILTTLSQITPQDVVFENVAISSSQISLSAKSFSLAGFSTLLQTLKSSENFRDLNLEKISEEEGAITFTLKMSFQKSSLKEK